MKIQYALISSIIAILVSISFASHRHAGEGEFSFVERYNSARYMALAGGGIASADGVEAVFSNPAGLIKIPGHSTTYFSYDYNTTGDHQGLLSYGISLNALYIAMTVGYTNFGEIEERNVDGNLTGVSHKPRNMVPMISVAGSFNDNFKWGVNLKMLTEVLAETSDSQQALGWAFDGGLIYYPKMKNLTLAIGLYNFGRKEVSHIKDGERHGSLNYSVKAGLNYRLKNMPKLNVLVDLEKPVYDYTRVILGFEFNLSEAFSFRLGARRDIEEIKQFFSSTFGSAAKDYYGGYWSVLNAGLALNLKYFNLSYGIEFLRYGIGSNHRIGLEIPLP